jgi:AcrR family transcriptional regulator
MGARTRVPPPPGVLFPRTHARPPAAGRPTPAARAKPVFRHRSPRSLETTARILDAAEELLRDRPLEAVRVVDVLRRARVSVGAFYARYPTKEHLFTALRERLLEDLRRHVLDMHDAATLVAPTAGEYLSALLARVAELYRAHAGVGRHLIVAAQSDPKLHDRLERLNRENLERIVADLGRLAGPHGPAPERERVFAFLVHRAVLRDALFFPGAWGAHPELAGQALVEELRRLMLRYLGLETPAPPPDRA